MRTDPRPPGVRRLRRRAGESDAGFGLIELVVALGVLAVVSLVSLRAIATGIATSALGRQQSVASALIGEADATLESDTAAELTSLVTSGATQPTTVGGVAYCLAEQASVGAGATANLFSVTLTVSWPASASCTGPHRLASRVQVAGS